MFLHAFCERCEKAFTSPVFEHQKIEDPAGGFNFKASVTFDKVTGKQKDAALSIDHFELRYYDEAIRLLHPFTLSVEDVFLSKVVQQIKYLCLPNTMTSLATSSNGLTNTSDSRKNTHRYSSRHTSPTETKAMKPKGTAMTWLLHAYIGNPLRLTSISRGF